MASASSIYVGSYRYDPVSNPTGNPREHGWYVIKGTFMGKPQPMLTSDTVVISSTTYYTRTLVGGGADGAPPGYHWVYTQVGNPTGNPQAQGWYVKSGNGYALTTDTYCVAGTIYYYRTLLPGPGDEDNEDTEGDKKGSGDSKSDTAKKNKDKLVEKALDFIKHNYKPDAFKVTVKAVDMHLLDSTVDTVQLGDIVKVIYNHSGDEKKGMCTAIQYDLMHPEETEYTIGDPETELK